MTITDMPAIAPNKRGVETREKLIESTIRLVAEWGPDAVNLRDIGREADQRNNSVCQHHFSTKAGVLAAAVGACLDDEVVMSTPLEADRTSVAFIARMLASKTWAYLVWAHPSAADQPDEAVKRRAHEIFEAAFLEGR